MMTLVDIIDKIKEKGYKISNYLDFQTCDNTTIPASITFESIADIPPSIEIIGETTATFSPYDNNTQTCFWTRDKQKYLDDGDLNYYHLKCANQVARTITCIIKDKNNNAENPKALDSTIISCLGKLNTWADLIPYKKDSTPITLSYKEIKYVLLSNIFNVISDLFVKCESFQLPDFLGVCNISIGTKSKPCSSFGGEKVRDLYFIFRVSLSKIKEEKDGKEISKYSLEITSKDSIYNEVLHIIFNNVNESYPLVRDKDQEFKLLSKINEYTTSRNIYTAAYWILNLLDDYDVDYDPDAIGYCIV